MVKHGGLGKWILLLCLSSLLAACGGEGGQAFVPDGTDTGNNTGAQNETPEQDVAAIGIFGQSLIIGTNSTDITIRVVDGNGVGVSNAAILINTDGDASPKNLTVNSDLSGEASVAISIPDGSNGGNVNVTISSGSVSQIATLFFGASVSFSESSRGGTVPADGTTPVTVIARARDFQDAPIADVPVSLSFSDDSFASAANTSGVTNTAGEFSTSITNQIAQTIQVTPVIGGISLAAVPITFSASSSTSSTPNSISIIVSKQNALADGSDNVDVNVIVRDQSNVPITAVPISLSTNSTTAILSEVIGETNESGIFATTLTNTTIETVAINAATGSLSTIQTVSFINPDTTTPDAGTTVRSVTIEISGRNTAPADGTETITVVGFARDASGNPVIDEPAEIQILNGSAIASPESGNTDSSGRFISDLTNRFAETVTVRARIGGIVSTQTVSAVFETVPSGGDVVVGSVSLSASPTSQPADGESAISLNALVRDSGGIPISGENVVLSISGAASGAAMLDAASGPTNDGGSFTTAMTNTATGQVTITATAQGVSSSPVTVNFLPATLVVASVTVTATPNNSPLLANGQDSTTLTVVARDANGTPVPNAPVTLIFSANEDSRPSSAVPAEGSGMTDAGGRFTTDITDTVSETFTVTARVGDGITGISSPISFLAATGATPASIDVTIDRDTQVADGSSPVVLTVIARDANNTPIQGVNISLSSTSGSALLSPATGATGDNGAFMSNITNTQAEAVTISARALPGGLTDSVTINFEGGSAVTPDEVFIRLTNNGADADGMDEVTVTVVVRNQGAPVPGTTVSLASASQTAIFGDSGASGTTSANGSFVTTLTNSQAETFTLTATSGAVQGSANVTFNPPTVPADPASIQLLSSSLVLQSEGRPEGVILSAILRTENNNPFVNGQVSFSADSGVIQAIPVGTAAPDTAGVTNDSGVAQARLTTVGNPVNRPIVVTATSGNLSASVTIEVSGTALTITGPDTAIVGSEVSFSLFLRDSGGEGIPGQALSISSALGNAISPANPVTDSSGRAEVIVTAATAGTDILTVTGAGADPVSQELRISDDNFCVIPVPDPRTNTNPNDICDPPLINEDANSNGQLDTGEDLNGNGLLDIGIPNVPLNTEQFFTVHWDRAGTPQPLQQINLSATRGELSAASVSTNTQGEAGFSIMADNAGPVTLTASTTTANGPSTQVTFNFVADNPATIELQASPSTVSVNTPGSNAEQSEIIAVVRDAENNLVQGQRIDFVLTDITGGRISPSSALTDNFGRASTVYTAGASSSSADGVSVTATVVGTNPVVEATVNLTVAQRGVFVTLGTGNEIQENDPDTRYLKPYTLLVNDINGVAVAGAQVTLSIIPIAYLKGNRVFISPRWRDFGLVILDANGDPQIDPTTGEISRSAPISCPNEDIDNDGILDAGEDINGNGRLDPGNVATLEPGTVTTDINGFADFTVIYPQENAGWVQVDLVARTVAAGSEDTDVARFILGGAASDFTNEAIVPPGTPSPYGVVFFDNPAQDCLIAP